MGKRALENIFDQKPGWKDDLTKLELLTIQRSLFHAMRITSIYLYFEMSSVGWLSWEAKTRTVKMTRTGFRSRKVSVAPIRVLKFPKLESRATMLAAYLSCEVHQAPSCQTDKTFLWTTSTTGLQSLNTCIKVLSSSIDSQSNRDNVVCKAKG